MQSSEVHIVVAIIINQQNEVLISFRPETVHQGGLWEFPGGKVEAGETALKALRREVSEELDIIINKAKPFKVIQHRYKDKTVLLDAWLVESFSGEPVKDKSRGAEGQLVKWQALNQLNVNEFPPANRSVIHSLILPEKYMITGAFDSCSDFISRLENSLKNGISLLQLRCKKLNDTEFLKLAKEAQLICKTYNAKLLLNTTADVFCQIKVDGLHLSSQQLHLFQSRPIGKLSLLSVSCHTKADIEQAERLAADIILLSPVKETTSHPGVKGIGWSGFSKLISNTSVPAYALGGMHAADIENAKLSGAQGIAAISSFW